jgi:hypothetical protein
LFFGPRFFFLIIVFGHLTKNSSRILLSRIGSRLKNSRFRRDSEQIEGKQERDRDFGGKIQGRCRQIHDRYLEIQCRYRKI